MMRRVIALRLRLFPALSELTGPVRQAEADVRCECGTCPKLARQDQVDVEAADRT